MTVLRENKGFFSFLLCCWAALASVPLSNRAITRLDVTGSLRHGSRNAARKNHDGSLTAYAWKPGARIPVHGESVDPSLTLQTLNDGLPFEETVNSVSSSSSSSSSIMTVDEIHRLGAPHLGVWVFALDDRERVLAVRRGETLVTCPNSWSLVGEHASHGEELHPGKTVLRGLREEIGSFLVPKFIKRHFNLMKDGLPVFYFRDYGPSMENRQDQQLTYFWYVEFNVPGETISKSMRHQMSTVEGSSNDEVMEHKWISVEELEQWINDRPDDFCDPTIHSFFQIGIRELKRVLAEQ